MVTNWGVFERALPLPLNYLSSARLSVPCKTANRSHLEHFGFLPLWEAEDNFGRGRRRFRLGCIHLYVAKHRDWRRFPEPGSERKQWRRTINWQSTTEAIS